MSDRHTVLRLQSPTPAPEGVFITRHLRMDERHALMRIALAPRGVSRKLCLPLIVGDEICQVMRYREMLCWHKKAARSP